MCGGADQVSKLSFKRGQIINYSIVIRKPKSTKVLNRQLLQKIGSNYQDFGSKILDGLREHTYQK